MTTKAEKIFKTCAVAGCARGTATVYPFCTDHMHRAYPCAVEGCGFMVAAYNKSGYCYDHRWVAQKVKRMARAAEAAGYEGVAVPESAAQARRRPCHLGPHRSRCGRGA